MQFLTDKLQGSKSIRKGPSNLESINRGQMVTLTVIGCNALRVGMGGLVISGPTVGILACYTSKLPANYTAFYT